jgi:hypothetical protein
MSNKILQLVLSIILLLVAGCKEEDFETKRIPLAEISLSVVDQTRVDNDHPTMVPPENRKDFVLAVSIGAQKEIYVSKGGKWVPDKKPVYFPDEKTPQDIYFECYYSLQSADKNQNTFDKIQQKDILAGVIQKQLPVNGLKNVVLKHKNSIIEVRLSDELVDKGDVYINNTIPYKYSSNVYQLIVSTTQPTSSIPFLIESSKSERYDCNLLLPATTLQGNFIYAFSLKLGRDLLIVESDIILSEWNIQKEAALEVIDQQLLPFMNLVIEGLDTKYKIILNREGLIRERITYNEDFQSYRVRYFKDNTGYEPTLSYFSIEDSTLNDRTYELGIKYESKAEVHLKLSKDGHVILRNTGIDTTRYVISSIEELKLIKKNNQGDFYQERDLYFDHSSVFQDNNSITDTFSGIYDGNDKTLYNISVSNIYDTKNKCWGLFKECQKAKITNLTIDNLVVTDNDNDNVKQIGGLIGYCSESEVRSCTIKNGSIVLSGKEATVGGMIGYADKSTLLSQLSIDSFAIKANNGKMTSITGGIVGYCDSSSKTQNCTVTNSNITTTGNLYTGGLVGYSSFIISNNTITGSTIQADGAYVGGVIAYADKGSSIANCRSESITMTTINTAGVTDTVYVGGIVGRYTSTKGMESCLAIGNTITSAKASVCGGIIGSVAYHNANKISNCKSIGGTISSTAISGGICGECYAANPAEADYDDPFRFENCTNSSRVIGNQYVGGICAKNERSKMYKCENSGEIGSSTSSYSGGICGIMTFFGHSPVDYCTNSGIVKGLTAGGIFGSFHRDSQFNEKNLTYLVGHCVNTVEAQIQGVNYAGGICGVAGYGGIGITGSKNLGSVTAVDCAGGICAKNEGNSVYICANSGKVEATANNSTTGIGGGICGQVTLYDTSDKQILISAIEITNCTNWGIVESKFAGGICGVGDSTQDKSTISFSLNQNINYGTIDSKKFNGGTSGGIIGKISFKKGDLHLKEGYNLGKIIGAGTNCIGGIIGLLEGVRDAADYSQVKIERCYVEITEEYIKALSQGENQNWGYLFGQINSNYYFVPAINDMFYAISGRRQNFSKDKLVGSYLSSWGSLEIEGEEVPSFTAPVFQY